MPSARRSPTAPRKTPTACSPASATTTTPHRRDRGHDRYRHRREAAGSAAVHARRAQPGLLRTDERPRVRSLDGDSLKRVSNSADGAKTRFVLIDAVGVEKSSRPKAGRWKEARRAAQGPAARRGHGQPRRRHRARPPTGWYALPSSSTPKPRLASSKPAAAFRWVNSASA